MVCFPFIKNSPNVFHFRDANKRACVCKYVYAKKKYLFQNRARHYFRIIYFHYLEIMGIKHRGYSVPKASLLAGQSLSAGHVPFWRGLVLASSLWVLTALWLSMRLADLCSFTGS